MKLGFIITARCNASCSHCSTNCGPTRSESLPQSHIVRLMNEAAQMSAGEPIKFSLSGGEPFLDIDSLSFLVAHGKALGATVTCVTNGFWASSPAKARAVASRVRDAGLAWLGVSTSPFHQKFIKRRRVELALGAAREAGITTVCKYVRSASDPLDEAEITAWAKAAGADHVEVIPLMPTLREGEHLPESEYARLAGLPTGRCPSPLISVTEDGRAHTCCTPGAFCEFLSLGDTNELALSQIRDRFYLSGRQQILRSHGPEFFARRVIAEGRADLLRTRYGSVCDLCTHIASDPNMAAMAARAADEFEAQQLVGMLDGLARGLTTCDVAESGRG